MANSVNSTSLARKLNRTQNFAVKTGNGRSTFQLNKYYLKSPNLAKYLEKYVI